jgi:predicted amidohydrolase
LEKLDWSKSQLHAVRQQVAKKVRLRFYLKDEEIKRQIKVAVKPEMTATDYCSQAIEEHFIILFL